jgi:sec-independent protein translocase protein TatB
MFGFSFWEIAMILVIALLVLGPKRLPALAKTVGKGLRKLQQASSELKSAIEEPLEEVRRPLEDMRNDLVQTVHNFEDEIKREAGEIEEAFDPYAKPAALEDDPYREEESSLDSEELPTEIDDRRREIEELYAASAAEDAAEDAREGAGVDAGEDTVVDAAVGAGEDTVVDAAVGAGEDAGVDAGVDAVEGDEDGGLASGPLSGEATGDGAPEKAQGA